MVSTQIPSEVTWPAGTLVKMPAGGQRIVSMVEFKGRLLVATDRGLFELVDRVLHPIPFVAAEPTVVTRLVPSVTGGRMSV